MNLLCEECDDQSNECERDRSEAEPAAAEIAAKCCNTESQRYGRTNELHKGCDIEKRVLLRGKTIRQSESVTARRKREHCKGGACYSEPTGDVRTHDV